MDMQGSAEVVRDHVFLYFATPRCNMKVTSVVASGKGLDIFGTIEDRCVDELKEHIDRNVEYVLFNIVPSTIDVSSYNPDEFVDIFEKYGIDTDKETIERVLKDIEKHKGLYYMVFLENVNDELPAYVFVGSPIYLTAILATLLYGGDVNIVVNRRVIGKIKWAGPSEFVYKSLIFLLTKMKCKKILDDS